MIQITFSTDAESGSISMRMKGHAMAGAEGHDLVCAAASMLGQTLAQLLLYQQAQGKLQKAAHIVLRPGRCEITAKPRKEHYDEVLYGFFVTEVGLELLAHNNADFARITLFDTAWDAFSKDSPT